ncbi:MAG: hypothetical protein IPK82_08745 [Polyangiaceae bacterium]|nr:hypothetical protein [Polyangiaceae bacterium]
MSAAQVETAASATTKAEPQTLRGLLEEGATSAQIAAFLDALNENEKLRQVLAVKGKWVGVLYDRVADAPPVSLDEFVPPDSVGTTLIYEGRNSLALFTRFQKRFLRTKKGVIVGYNHQTMMWFTGPGYFVFQPADGNPPVPNEPFIDYVAEPPVIPEGWPKYKSNEDGMSKAVYYNMHDYMRRVAKNVYVGKAYRLAEDIGPAEDIGAYFSLTLQPPGYSE